MKLETTKEIFETLIKKLPTEWDGKQAITYMKENNCRNWKQMEWIGFYFQFMCEKIIGENNYFQIPGKKYGSVQFDGFKEINFDFKAHSSINKFVPTNGY
ncbi:hypothetical protein CJJ23_04835 [Mycoplasmopsis agassizii]|uniref:Uncharacterized protein n=1 Tax=Mycoplasmopsis agassizii TaxID=33922 RepID=A0A269THF8_9BACT|nr:hypothetical protein [Mycoplasmopsis agassizii]PAK20892.1 hypothetical protein CJJ23_04835 [Mycoplasmopsis agassizii]